MPISTNRNNRCNFCSTFGKILDSSLPPIHSITRLAYGFTLGYNFNSFVFPYSGATDFLLPFPAAIDLESQIAFNLKKPPDLMMHGLFAVEGRVFCHSWNDDDPDNITIYRLESEDPNKLFVKENSINGGNNFGTWTEDFTYSGVPGDDLGCEGCPIGYSPSHTKAMVMTRKEYLTAQVDINEHPDNQPLMEFLSPSMTSPLCQSMLFWVDRESGVRSPVEIAGLPPHFLSHAQVFVLEQTLKCVEEDRRGPSAWKKTNVKTED